MATKTLVLPKGVRKGKDGRFYWEFDKLRTDGSRFRKAGSVKTAEEAASKLKSAAEDFESNEQSTGRVPTFGEWCEYFKTDIMPVMPSRSGKPYSPRTVQGYVAIIDATLVPMLGDIILNKMTPEHVESMLKKAGGEAQTRKNIRNLGSKLYEVAQLRAKATHGFNPFKAVLIAKPKMKRDSEGHEISHVRVLTADEEKRLFAEAECHWCFGAILIAIKCGLRMGEVLGLEWANIDFDKGTLTVRQQRQRITKKTRDLMGIKSKGGLMKLDPKSDWGFRMIPLPTSALKWLQDERTRNQTPFVIPNINGNNPKEPRRLTQCFNDVVTKAEITIADEHGKPLAKPTFHDLRHTWCTRHANDYRTLPHVLKKLAGHSRIETTLGYYVHAEEGDLFSAQHNVS